MYENRCWCSAGTGSGGVGDDVSAGTDAYDGAANAASLVLTL